MVGKIPVSTVWPTLAASSPSDQALFLVNSFLVDENTLAIANKWRRERGDPEITMAELIKE